VLKLFTLDFTITTIDIYYYYFLNVFLFF